VIKYVVAAVIPDLGLVVDEFIIIVSASMLSLSFSIACGLFLVIVTHTFIIENGLNSSRIIFV